MNLTRNSIRVQGYPCTLMFSIEEITAGMLVYAHNPDTGETELKEVVQTFVNETNELVHIKVSGEEIITTPTHPFWVPEKGWTDAIQLRAGDRLQLLNGEYVIVEQVQHEILEAPVTVYNFEVEDFHTYYVSDSAILVHNKCNANGLGKSLPKNGSKLNASDALDLANDFLGEGYTEMSPGRFVSSDGLRQVRMSDADLLGLHGGGPHINFDILFPKYKSVHVFFYD